MLLSTLPAFPFKVSPRLGDFRGRETKMINRDALYAHRRAKRDALDAQLAVLDADYKAKRDALYAHRRAKLAVLDAHLAVLDADYKAKRDALDAHRRAKCDALDAHRRAKCDALDAQLAADHRAKCDALNKARRDHAEARRHVGTVQRVDVSSKAHCSLAPRVANNESCSHPKGD